MMTSSTRIRTVPVVALAARRNNKKKKPNDDRPASKYCFRATVRIIDTEHGNRPFGVFTNYNSTVDAGKVVENACEVFRNTIMPDRLVCEDAEVVLYDECPVEITDEIHFTRIVDATD